MVVERPGRLSQVNLKKGDLETAAALNRQSVALSESWEDGI